MVSLLVVACAVSQAAGPLCAPGHGAAPQGIDAQRPYVLSAAYPFWRAATFPPEAIPFEFVHQIDHCFVMPGEHGTLQVPNGFVMPELLEMAHRADRKVILGVGGANSHDAFATMAADPHDRGTFVRHLTDFVLDQGYDGVTIDWEFPQTPADRQNLTALMAELRAGLDATDGDLALSIAVSSNEQRGQWVDVETITPLVHHYVVMTFGYHGAWGSESGHNAPLYPPPLQESQVTPHHLGRGCVDQSLRYWTQTRGVPRSKIVMGLPSFGIWFDSEGLYQPFTSSRKADYRDIKPLIEQSQDGNGYTYHWDATAQVPYLTQDTGPGLWSYDDPQSVGVKCDYVLANELGGIAVWDVTMDLVAGEHELLKVIAHKLMPYRIYLPSLRKG
ncbi:glycoside hydrolase family 18 protein [Chloroflexota bacterium]